MGVLTLGVGDWGWYVLIRKRADDAREEAR